MLDYGEKSAMALKIRQKEMRSIFMNRMGIKAAGAGSAPFYDR
jgi:hypothetical protein